MQATTLAELATLLERHTGCDGAHPTALPPLQLHRLSHPGEPLATVCEPALCVIARGRKQVRLGDEVYVYDPAHFLLVSVGLPIVNQVVAASAAEPYLALKIELDLGRVGELLMDLDEGSAVRGSRPPGRGLAVSATDAPLLDAVTRLVALLDRPDDLRILAPLVLREITYRVLMGEQGPRLRQIVAEGGRGQRIATAIDWLRRHFDQQFRVEHAARVAHMSPSAFHQHFKAVTALTPLQYQKWLRLQEARRLMLGGGLDAAAAGYRVGYESASQFSRDYRRAFGEPPRRDLARLRVASAAVRAEA